MSVVEAIKSGLSPVSIKEELLALEARQIEPKRRLTEPGAPPLSTNGWFWVSTEAQRSPDTSTVAD